MITRYERMIAGRYLLPGRGEGFIFLVASISLIAVALGVAALIAVMSVMNGFRAELFDRILGLNGHAVIQGYGGKLAGWAPLSADVRRLPGVVSATPLIEQPLMASFGGRVQGVLVRGMTVGDIRATHVIADQRQARQSRRAGPRQHHGRHRRAACRGARCRRRRHDQPDLARRRGDAVRQRAAHRRLPDRRDLRGRHLRLRQGVCRHADGERADSAPARRRGRRDRGGDDEPRPGRPDPRPHQGPRRARRPRSRRGRIPTRRCSRRSSSRRR